MLCPIVPIGNIIISATNREDAIIREVQGKDEQGNIREGDADEDKKRH